MIMRWFVSGLIKISLRSFVLHLLTILSSSSLRMVPLGVLLLSRKSSRFNGQVITQNDYAMSVESVSIYSGAV
jgi:hypothetical protein